MTLPLILRKAAADPRRRRSFEPVVTLTAEGLVLGGTILAPASSDPAGTLATAEERILALLAVAYGKTVRPEVLGNIRRATRYWRQGENALAAIEIALSGLPPLSDEKQAAARLSLGEQLLAAGLAPRELVELCGLDPALFDVLKAGYDPESRASPPVIPMAANGPPKAVVRHPLPHAMMPARQRRLRSGRQAPLVGRRFPRFLGSIPTSSLSPTRRCMACRPTLLSSRHRTAERLPIWIRRTKN